MYIIAHLSVLGDNPEGRGAFMLAPAASDLSGFGDQWLMP